MVAAAVLLGEEHADRVAAPVVGGSFWSAANDAGRPLRNRSLDDGLWLAPGDVVAVDRAEGDDLRFRRVDLELRPAGRQSSTLHLDFRSAGTARVRLTLSPRRDVSAQLVERAEDGVERVVAAVEAEGRRPRERRPFRLSLRFDGPRVAAWLDEAPLIEGTVARPAEGAFRLSSDGVRLLGLRVEARLPGDDGAAPLVMVDDLSRPPVGRARPWAARTLGGLALVLLVGLWLRALCLGRPTIGALLRAALAVAAPAALPVVLRAAWDPPFLPLVAGGLALLGVPIALFVLRNDLDASGARSRADGARALAVSLPLVAAAGALAWDARADRVEAAAARAREDVGTLTLDPVARPEPERLDAGSAIVLGGSYGSYRLAADVTLGDGAALEVRRGRTDAAIGSALVVSDDPRWPSGFLRLGQRRIERLGDAGPVAAAGETARLELVVRGTALRARLDDAPLAEAVDLDAAADAVTLVAVRGAVDVARLSLQPIPPGEVGARGPGLEEARPFGLAALVLLAAAGVASWLLRRPFLRTFEVVAFAFVPASIALLGVDDGTVPTAWTFAAAAAAAGVAVGLPWAHGRTSTTPRLVGAAVVTIAAGAGGTVILLPGPGDGSDASAVRAIDFATFLGPSLLPGWVHYQHPRSRAMNGWLAGHAFRGRRFAAGRRPSGARVVCVGTSSTWGAGTPETSGLDWPTVMESGLPVGTEVINGGVRGSNALLLSVLHEEVFARFDPDVVVVTLFHNDAVGLPQFDAPALLARLLEAEAFGSVARFLARREIAAGVAANRRFLERWAPGDDAVALWRDEAGALGERTPPERFEAAFDRLLRRAVADGARPVLVKEPVFADAPSVWRAEFDAVIDRLGARYDAPVVDPTPRLAREGGRVLFIDHVHPSPRGHRLMAEIVAPAVAGELARGRRP